MIAFFVILVALMVLIAALGTWNNGPRRRVVHDRSVVADRRPDLVEEVVYEDDPPVATTRRVVRRRRTLR